MNKLHIQYKSETGESPTIHIESSEKTDILDVRCFEPYTKAEILSMLSHDEKYNSKPGIYVDDLPDEFLLHEDVILPSYEYVRWLEDLVVKLQLEVSSYYKYQQYIGECLNSGDGVYIP